MKLLLRNNTALSSLTIGDDKKALITSMYLKGCSSLSQWTHVKSILNASDNTRKCISADVAAADITTAADVDALYELIKQVTAGNKYGRVGYSNGAYADDFSALPNLGIASGTVIPIYGSLGSGYAEKIIAINASALGITIINYLSLATDFDNDEAAYNYCVENWGDSNGITASQLAALTDDDAVSFAGTDVEKTSWLRHFTNAGFTAFPSFTGCISLESATVPLRFASVPNEAFKDCTSLATLQICEQTIGTDAFKNTAITSLEYLPGTVNIKALGLTDVTSVTIPNTAITLEQECFRGYKFTSIDIPNSVTTIGNGAFTSCSFLHDIVFPDSVAYFTNNGTVLTYFAFDQTLYGCYRLYYETLGAQIAVLGNYAFQYRSSIHVTLRYDGIVNNSTGPGWAYHFFNGSGHVTNFFVPVNRVAEYRAHSLWTTKANLIGPFINAYYNSGNMYSDSAHQTLIVPDTTEVAEGILEYQLTLYIDQHTGDEYTYNGSNYVKRV